MSKLATTFGIKRGTTWSIIRRHQDVAQRGEPVFPARGGARTVKVDNEIREAAARIVEEHPEFTLQQINNELRLRLPHKPLICLSSLRKALQCQLVTLKIMENVPVDRNRDDVVKMPRLMLADECNMMLQNEQEIISCR